MANITCYKCESEIPPGYERCPSCGAPAPLSDEELDKHKIKAATVLEGFIPSPSTKPSAGGASESDPGATHVMNPESATRIVNPEPATRIVNPEPATRIVNPESATRIVNPESATRIVNPESATRIVNPESATRIVNPESATRIVNPESATRVVTPTPPPPSQPHPASTPAHPEKPRPPKPEAQPVKKKNSTWTVLVTVLCVVAAAIAAYLYFSAQTAERNAETRYLLAPAYITASADPYSETVDSLPYGASVVILGHEGPYVRVKSTSGAHPGSKGYIKADALLSEAEMALLSALVTEDGDLAPVDRPHWRKALTNYLTLKRFTPETLPYSLMTTGTVPEASPEIFCERVFAAGSRYEDFAFILRGRNGTTGNRLVYYTFDDNATPRLRFERNVGNHTEIVSASRTGSGPRDIEVVTQ